MNKSIKGTVKKHKGLGHKLGYPTANIDIAADTEEGIFAGYTTISPLPNPPHPGEGRSPFLPAGRGGKVGVKLPSLIFIGAAETFGETDKELESHILNFNGDLYGQEIEVEILKKLRNGIKFDSAEALVAQMKLDELAARKYFGL